MPRSPSCATPRRNRFPLRVSNLYRTQIELPQLGFNLRAIADSLGLPEDAGTVYIEREQGRISIESHYEETVDMPGFKRDFHFEPRVAGSY